MVCFFYCCRNPGPTVRVPALIDLTKYAQNTPKSIGRYLDAVEENKKREKIREDTILVGKRDKAFVDSLTDSTELFCCKCHYFVSDFNPAGRRHPWAVPHDLPCPEGHDPNTPLPDPERTQRKRRREDEDTVAAQAELVAARRAEKEERAQRAAAQEALQNKARVEQEDRDAFHRLSPADQAVRLAGLFESEKRYLGQVRKTKKLKRSMFRMRIELVAQISARLKAQKESRKLRAATKKLELELIKSEATGKEVNEKLLRELEVSSRLLTHNYCVTNPGWLETLTGFSPRQYLKLIEEVEQNHYLGKLLGPELTASGKTKARNAADPRDLVMSFFARFRHNLSLEWVAKVSGLTSRVVAFNFYLVQQMFATYFKEVKFVNYPLSEDEIWANVDKDKVPAGLKYGIVVDGTFVPHNTPANSGVANRAFSQYKAGHGMNYQILSGGDGSTQGVSEGAGGRTSDKEMLTKSRLNVSATRPDIPIIDYVKKGDTWLGDRGYKFVADLFLKRGAKILVPPSSHGNDKDGKEIAFTEEEDAAGRDLATERIIVERLNARIKGYRYCLNPAITAADRGDSVYLAAFFSHYRTPLKSQSGHLQVYGDWDLIHNDYEGIGEDEALFKFAADRPSSEDPTDDE